MGYLELYHVEKSRVSCVLIRIVAKNIKMEKRSNEI